MDFGDGQEAASSSKKGRNRHTYHQTQVLEEFFKECTHPNEKQRRRLGMELGPDPVQIKFWFQNKRNQIKNQHERVDNYNLRNGNEKILFENLAYKETLKYMICKTCAGYPVQNVDKQTPLHKLQVEHIQILSILKYNELSTSLTKQLGKSLSQIDGLFNACTGSALNVPSLGCTRNKGSRTSSVDPAANPSVIPCNPTSLAHAQQIKGMPGTTNDFRVTIAAEALRELAMLLQMNEPFWVKSSCGTYTLDHQNYEKMFSRVSHYKNPGARFESSKDSKEVNINAVDLVCMLLNPDQWAHNFCTIVRKAETIEVIKHENLGRQQSDHLQLMYAQMHILSPLVAPREFYFLRYCRQMEAGVWIVADVSYDYIKGNIFPSRSWRFPSGCMIQEMPSGFSKVTWVEHVEVDDKTQTHRLYKEVLGSDFAYGAERWTSALQRMGERLSLTMFQDLPTLDGGAVIDFAEAKRNIMKLSSRMVKNFCCLLNMSGKSGFPQVSDVDTSGVRVSVSKSTEFEESKDIIVSAATSLWLPLPLDAVFCFLTDENTRNQWDVLSSAKPVQQVSSFHTANQPGNFISIIMPTYPNENNMMILQESSMDNLSALVVRSPIYIPTFCDLASPGEDTSSIPLLPSGFTIIGDGHPLHTGIGPHPVAGSLLTVAIQILASSSSTLDQQMNVESSIACANTIISATARNIKMALNCGGMD